MSEEDLYARIRDLRDCLRMNGFVPCDSAACNCGSWHARFGLRERMDEVASALGEAGYPLCNGNGNLTLNALRGLIAERDAANAEIERLTAERDALIDKALRFDLDAAGIEQRERESVELVELRARNNRQAKRLWYVEHLLRSAYPFVPSDTAWDFDHGGYLQDLIDRALGEQR